jgi:hypothetical protein
MRKSMPDRYFMIESMDDTREYQVIRCSWIKTEFMLANVTVQNTKFNRFIITDPEFNYVFLSGRSKAEVIAMLDEFLDGKDDIDLQILTHGTDEKI